MSHRFTKHYTLSEARALLPQVRAWLTDLREEMRQLHKLESQLKDLGRQGDDLGGSIANEWFRTLTRVAEIYAEFYRRQIFVKDVERGLIDFPALRGDREVFLCWEMDEDDILFWHDLDTGYAGREHVDD